MQVQQRTIDKRIFVYVLNSRGLVKVVKKKYCQISRTQEQTKPVKGNFSRKTCSSYRRVSELVKKLVKEDLTGTHINMMYWWMMSIHSKVHMRRISMASCAREGPGADYMEIFQPGLRFSPVCWVEMSARLKTKIVVKCIERLHDENFSPGWVSTRAKIPAQF